MHCQCFSTRCLKKDLERVEKRALPIICLGLLNLQPVLSLCPKLLFIITTIVLLFSLLYIYS